MFSALEVGSSPPPGPASDFDVFEATSLEQYMAQTVATEKDVGGEAVATGEPTTLSHAIAFLHHEYKPHLCGNGIPSPPPCRCE